VRQPVLFSPEAHESLGGEAWGAERVWAAITAVVAEAEAAFDDVRLYDTNQAPTARAAGATAS
jgi:hypothetical protein